MSLTAVYNYPERGYRPATQLEVGKEYHVERVNMGQSTTDIHLSGLGCFNSVHFDFFEDGKPIDIYRSPKYNPYLRGRTMATEQRLIDANALKDRWTIPSPEPINTDAAEVLDSIDEQPTVDAVSRGVHDQVRWERDTAIGQLEQHGIPFCGIAPDVVKVVRCKDCKSCKMCYPEKQIGKEATPGWFCKEHKSYRRPDDFCSYGERRTDG